MELCVEVSAIKERKGEYQVKEIKGRRMGMGYLVDLHLVIEPYIFSKEMAADFKALEQHIISCVPHIHGVAITASVDKLSFQSSESYLKNRVYSILKHHAGMYK